MAIFNTVAMLYYQRVFTKLPIAASAAMSPRPLSPKWPLRPGF